MDIGILGRRNPIFYIKGINEKHSMQISELPISYEDLNSAYMDLLQDKKSEDLFQNIDKNRIRRFINNPFDIEDNMTEYEQRGKAWENDKEFATGREFNR